MSRSTRNAPAELTTLEAQIERDETDAAPIVGTPPAKRHRGQPALLTPEKQRIICDVIASGNYQKLAAEAAGISDSVLLKWRAKGRDGIEPYASLERAIEQADRDCETALVKKVMDASDEDWRAAAMLLERKFPERWSRYRERALLEGNFVATAGFAINIHLDPRDVNPPVTIAPSRPLLPDSEPEE